MKLFVVPDGNRRWAEERGLCPTAGYASLAESIVRVIRGVKISGAKKLFLWCNSPANLFNRPKEQIICFTENYLRIAEALRNNGLEDVRVRVRGNLALFSQVGLSEFESRFRELERVADGAFEFELYYFVNYSTLDDIDRASQRANAYGGQLEDVLNEMEEPSDIDGIVRTGGHHRLSGLSLIRSPNAELIFIDKLFPDIVEDDIMSLEGVFRQRVVNNGA